MGADMDDPED
jgi:hypothetical protein